MANNIFGYIAWVIFIVIIIYSLRPRLDKLEDKLNKKDGSPDDHSDLDN